MTFHAEFVAENADIAIAAIDADKSIPDPIKVFLRAALRAIPESHGCYVRAKGHLYKSTGDYDVSDCEIKVYRVKRV